MIIRIQNTISMIPWLLVLIIGICFMSCTHTNKKTTMLYRAETLMEKDSVQAAAIFKDMPDIDYLEPNFFNIHNKRCVVNLYLNKAQSQLKQRDFNGLRSSIEHVLEWETLLIYQEKNNITLEKKEKLRSQCFLLAQNTTLLNENQNNHRTKDSLTTIISKNLQEMIRNNAVLHQTYDSFVERKVINHRYYWIVVLFTITSLAIYLFYQRTSVEVSQLKSMMFRNQNKIHHLLLQLKQNKSDNYQNIGSGKQIYDSIKNGGNMKNISIENEQFFINYFAYSYPQEYHNIVSCYNSLTLRHTTYLILKYMGFNDSEIQQILFVRASTIRNYRLRIKKHII